MRAVGGVTLSNQLAWEGQVNASPSDRREQLAAASHFCLLRKLDEEGHLNLTLFGRVHETRLTCKPVADTRRLMCRPQAAPPSQAVADRPAASGA